MFSRLRAFLSRHKKKLIFTTVFAGGAWCAVRFFLPTLQNWMLQRLMKKLQEEQEVGKKEAERSFIESKFTHTQQVSDSYMRKHLMALSKRHKEHFKVDDLLAKAMKHNGDATAKAEAFKGLQLEIVARLASAAYTLNLMILLHRVEFNIIGRQLKAPKDSETEVHEAFLKSTLFIQDGGLKRITEVLRTASKSCIEKAAMTAETKVTRESLERLLLDICREADDSLVAGQHCVTTVLPEACEKSFGKHREKVKPLLHEAQDYLESPQFLQVFRSLVDSSIRLMVLLTWQDFVKDSADSCAMAALFGPFLELSWAALTEASEDKNKYASRFKEEFTKEPLLNELCEVIYSQPCDEDAQA